MGETLLLVSMSWAALTGAFILLVSACKKPSPALSPRIDPVVVPLGEGLVRELTDPFTLRDGSLVVISTVHVTEPGASKPQRVDFALMTALLSSGEVKTSVLQGSPSIC